MQVRTIWDSDAHAQQVAQECVFISGPFSMPRLAVMMAANPQLIFAPYLKSVQNPVASDSGGTKYPNKWYAHFKDGTKAKQGGQFVNWVMESGYYAETHAAATPAAELSSGTISASSWAEYHVKDSAAKVASTNAQAAQAGKHPFRGLWFDSNDTFSADATPGFFTSATNPGWDPHLLSAYTKPNFVAMAHWIGDMAQNLTSAGTANPERLFTAANGLRSVSIADHYDMAMAEGWMVSGGLGGSMTRGTAGWDHSVDLALQCQAKGAVCEILEWGLSSDSLAVDRQKRRFIAGSYLIAHRGLMTMEYGTLKSTAPHLETAKDTALYALDLGTPLTGQSPTTAAGHAVAVGTGNGQASATGLRARLFDGGTVLVNPTAAAINYKASKSYTLVPDPGGSPASYVAGNLIAVAAGHAVILTTSGGSGGTAPSHTRVPELIGTPREGQTIWTRRGAYTGSPTPVITSQLRQASTSGGTYTDITGATGQTYTIPYGSSGTPTTYITDAFGRTSASGFGSADTGGAYAVEVGATGDFSVGSGTGAFSHSAANTGKMASLNLGQADADAVVTFNFPSVAAGGNLQASLILRWQDASNYLRLNIVQFATGGHVTINPDKVIAGAATSLGTSKDLGVYTAGAGVKVRLRLSASNLKGKAWLAASSEPAGWDWDVTDSSIIAAGKLVLRSFRGAANTNTSPQTRVDNLTVTSLTGTTTGFIGQYFKQRETATNSAGSDTADSAAFGPILDGATTDPLWTALPSVSGTPSEGATLTANPGTVASTAGAVTIAYQWEQSATTNPGSASNVTGETSQTYSPASGMAGNYVRAKVSATQGTVTVSQWTPWLGPLVAGDTPPSFSVNPAITGSTVAGQTLTATLGTATGSPTPSTGTPTWQYSTDGGATAANITPAANATTYLLQSGDQGHLIRIAVPASNRAGTTQGYSDWVGPVTLPASFPDLTLDVVIE